MKNTIEYIVQRQKSWVTECEEYYNWSVWEELSEAKEDLENLKPSKYLLKEYHANTGNYDPSSDCYWIVLKCLRCGKHWIEDDKGLNKDKCLTTKK